MKVGLHPFFKNYFHLGANENKRFNSFSLGQKGLNHFDTIKIIQLYKKTNIFYFLSAISSIHRFAVLNEW